jgi:O-acetyl-ADP-ribose deacetylase (regulator of RNase III)
MENINLILVDPKPDLCAAYHERFAGLPNVEIVQGRFENLPEFDCMVSAANSFGLMDGGVDLAIIDFFGAELERKVQQRILENYLGEQPVGTSFILETGHPRHPYLAHTPTMRIPLSIARTDHVYLAMWAMLLAVRKHNQSQLQPIRTIACPGLGTATGRVPVRRAAKQMALAYRNFLNPPSSIDWSLAMSRQQEVWFGGDDGCLTPPELDV